MTLSTLALRWLWRDWRGGELALIIAALVLTVTASTAVGFFAERLERALQRQGGELLAADLVVDGSMPLPEEWREQARMLGLTHTELVDFRSVVMRDARSQLVAVKAVAAGYPLRGRLQVKHALEAPAETVNTRPAPGTVWVEARLLATLGLSVGERLTLGRATFVIAHILAYEPDRGADFWQLAPRVLLNLEDLAATGLLTPASRAHYRLLLAGPAPALAAFADWVRPRRPPHVELSDARTARPELAGAIDRAARLLRLVTLATLTIAGAALMLASHRLVARQTEAVALMRCLGAPRRALRALWVLRLLWLGIIASMLGGACGYLAHWVLTAMLAVDLHTPLPPASLRPLLVGMAVGLLALAGCALPPVWQLARVPPLRALRHDPAGFTPAPLGVALGASAALMLLLLWQAGTVALAWRVLGGLLLAVLALALGGGLLIGAARLAVARVHGIWRLGLAGVARRPGLTVLQLVGVGLGLTALLVLVVVRIDLLRAWERSVPATAPNYFLINIQPEEVAPLRAFLAEQQLTDSGILPMIRGRLLAIGGQPVHPEQYPTERARRLAAREFNLSVATVPQRDNRIVAGTWWAPEETMPQFSVEQELASTLGIALGDELRFWVAGRELAAPVTSLRAVRWDSFNVNFFVVAPPAVLADQPATYVTSFYLPPGREATIAALHARFPSVTPLEVGALLAEVRGVIERGARAIEFVLAFALLAGALTLVAALQASLDERHREHEVLRVLGAQRGQLRARLGVEFGTLGLLAGLLAATSAALIGWAVARWFELPFAFAVWRWLGIALGCALVIGVSGTLGAAGALRRMPGRKAETYARCSSGSGEQNQRFLAD